MSYRHSRDHSSDYDSYDSLSSYDSSQDRNGGRRRSLTMVNCLSKRQSKVRESQKKHLESVENNHKSLSSPISPPPICSRIVKRYWKIQEKFEKQRRQAIAKYGEDGCKGIRL